MNERERMIDLYHHPAEWTTKPFLPLFHDERNQLGLMVQGRGATVFMVNLVDAFVAFAESGSRTNSPEFRRWLNTHPRFTYMTFGVALDDGWEID